MNANRERDVFYLRHIAVHLATTDKGRDALRRVLDWLESSGLSLDSDNQQGILLLLDAAWGDYAGTVRDLMREALREPDAMDGFYTEEPK